MKKRNIEEGGGDSWLNTYADMVTLLLTFFAVLLSMSTVNQEKFNAFIKSFSSLPQETIDSIVNYGGAGEDDTGQATVPTKEETESAMNELYNKLTNYVTKNGKEDAVSLSKGEDEVIYIRFDNTIFFEPDKYVIKSESRPTLEFLGDALKNFESDIKLITITGHTATMESSKVSDWILSGERAAVVAMYLDDQRSFDPKKITIIGHANAFPVASNDTEQGRRKNRRVEMAIIGKNSSIKVSQQNNINGQQIEQPISPEDVLLPPNATTSSDESKK